MNTYSNESFDQITFIALCIADRRRLEGRRFPAYGYSAEDWNEAQQRVQNSKK